MSFRQSERTSSTCHGEAPQDRERVSSEGCVSPRFTATAPPSAADVVAGNDTRSQGVYGDYGNVVPGVVLGVDAKRRRVTADSMLESEGDVPADDLAEFVDRMESLGVEAGSERWRSYWREHAESRPEVHSDYAFFRNHKGDRVHMPVLVSKSRKTKSISAHVVPKKGTGGGWIVQQYLRDLKKQGLRGKVVLRSDGEPAIVDLLNRVADIRMGETLIENSPVGDSRANGEAERAVQSVQKQTRTIKLATERNFACKLSVEHPCFPWMVEHCADLLDKFVVSKDGRTSYERSKGRKYNGLMFPFKCRIIQSDFGLKI